MSRLDTLVEQLKTVFGDRALGITVALGEVTLRVKAADHLDVARTLRDDPRLAFAELIDLCGVDYASYGEGGYEGPRYAVVLHLLSIEHNWRLRVRTFCPDDDFPLVASVTEVWSCADWYEREAFDLYGVVFEGHPDLRRILTDYGFVGHPFRKDFPISGHVEMRYDPDLERVVYEPVSIEPRVLVPKVIRADSRYANPTPRTDASDA